METVELIISFAVKIYFVGEKTLLQGLLNWKLKINFDMHVIQIEYNTKEQKNIFIIDCKLKTLTLSWATDNQNLSVFFEFLIIVFYQWLHILFVDECLKVQVLDSFLRIQWLFLFGTGKTVCFSKLVNEIESSQV